MNFLKKFFGINDAEKSTVKTRYHQQYKSPKGELLTATQIAKYFDISAQKVNSIFLRLGWIKKVDKLFIVTDKGLLNGAEEKYHSRSKTKYVARE